VKITLGIQEEGGIIHSGKMTKFKELFFGITSLNLDIKNTKNVAKYINSTAFIKHFSTLKEIPIELWWRPFKTILTTKKNCCMERPCNRKLPFYKCSNFLDLQSTSAPWLLVLLAVLGSEHFNLLWDKIGFCGVLD